MLLLFSIFKEQERWNDGWENYIKYREMTYLLCHRGSIEDLFSLLLLEGGGGAWQMAYSLSKFVWRDVHESYWMMLSLKGSKETMTSNGLFQYCSNNLKQICSNLRTIDNKQACFKYGTTKELKLICIFNTYSV